ncbi:hypothetical protein [Leifsonia poae]|nr:hypothetical protein [Leifsonia poae]
MASRVADLADMDAVTETITPAFSDDPIRGPALEGVGGRIGRLTARG